MNAVLSGLAAIALVPAMTGLPPADAQRVITVALCTGGSLTIPVGGEAPAKGAMPCCAKGCREKRRRPVDRKPG